jgi:hypothetical protein
MALYVSEIIFTGEKKPLERPPCKRVAIRAKTLDEAAKKTAKYARKFWPYWRFDVKLLSSPKVLE